MDNVHNRFGDRLAEVTRVHKALAQGRTIELNRDEEIGKMFPERAGVFKKDHFPRSPKAFNWMVITYYVVLLEAMLKDYVLHFSCGGCRLSNRPDYDREEEIFMEWHHPTDDETHLPHDEWMRFVKRRVSDIEAAEFGDNVESYEVEEARVRVRESSSSFPYRRILLKSVIIRNLIVHNSGKMNELNHKRAPFCSVGETPDVGIYLLYDVSKALFMLNHHLASSESN